MDLWMDDTSIDWTDATWNPVQRTVISQGAPNCYAMRIGSPAGCDGHEENIAVADSPRAASERSDWRIQA